MNITSFSRDEITREIEKARNRTERSESVRIIFSPQSINSTNIEEVSIVYSQLEKNNYDTVVVVETHTGEAEKKLPMPSFKSVETSLGSVEADDGLRNDFADEDDDFFINDDAFDDDVSLYDQLMLLQCTLEDFKILSIQITDERSFFVKELVSALEEILASKRALIVFCCDLERSKVKEFRKVISMIENDDQLSLMNYLNNGESSIDGTGAFISGLLVAKKWRLRFSFDALNGKGADVSNLLTGFADMQPQAIFK